MRHCLPVCAVLALVTSAPALAQPSAERAPSQTRQAGSYNALSDSDKPIVRAIYEAQLDSPNDSAGGKLLTRDDIAALHEAKGWGDAYAKLFKQGMVRDKTLTLAIDAYKHSIKATRGVTVINTGSGEQLAFATDKREPPQPPTGKTPVKPSPNKAASVTPVTPPRPSGSATGSW